MKLLLFREFFIFLNEAAGLYLRPQTFNYEQNSETIFLYFLSAYLCIFFFTIQAYRSPAKRSQCKNWQAG